MNFTTANDSRVLRWQYKDRFFEQTFDTPVRAIALRDETGLLVVEPAGASAPDNATILNADGSLRARIMNPEAPNGARCFGDAYYVFDELTLIICFASTQMACVIDTGGNVVRTYETR